MEAAELAQALDAAVDEHAFSGVVDIRRRDAVVYSRAAGYADREARIANTPATRFGIASGTKFLTALAIGKLIEAGQLAFSTRLRDCVALPFPRYSPEITIRHLLTHTSGIPDYYDEEKVADVDNVVLGVPNHQLRGPRDYLAVFPDEPMKFAPGSRFAYSNGGYILLGVVVEELSGMAYRKFVTERLLRPAGMSRSGFFAMDRLPENTARGYIRDGDHWRSNADRLPIVGASDGGAFTTAEDMATLWTAFLDGRILSSELVDVFATPWIRVEAKGPHLAYGHGLWIREKGPGDRIIHVTGSDAGVSFKSSVHRTTDLRVTVMSNTTQGAWPILREIDRLLP